MVMPADLAAKESQPVRARVADPALRHEIEAAVRRRISGSDADDIVQAALADVLSAPRTPEDGEEFRRFVFAVTRNKVFDHFRRRAREASEDEAQEPAADEAPLAARDILRWAEGKLPDAEAEHTLEWMLREGDGEKLEHIARDANLPAPRVRQRVSRLRRLLREHWALELGLTALGLVLLAGGAALLYRHVRRAPEVATPELHPEPLQRPEQRGQELRRFALEQCAKGADQACLEGLDRARALDPAGDAALDVTRARSAAAARLAPAPSTPSPSATPLPSERAPLAPTAIPKPQMPSHRTAPISTEATLPAPPAPHASSIFSGTSDSSSDPVLPAKRSQKR